MRIVIDIPDDNYKRIRELAEVNGLSNNLMGYSLLAIAHGTVLPKGHGDLIDRKDLIENGISKGFCDWYDEIKMADTIIEADNEADKENEND